MRHPLRAALIGALASAVVLAGCSGSDEADPDDGGASQSGDAAPAGDPNGVADLPIDEALNAVRTAMVDDLTSVRVQADIGEGEQAFLIDVAIDDAGDCAGSISGGGTNIQVLRADDRQFFKVDPDYWLRVYDEEVADQVIETVGDGWIEGDPASDAATVNQICAGGLDGLGGQAVGGEIDGSQWSEGEQGDVDGVPAFSLVKQAEGGDATVWVAQDGPPWILLAERGSESTYRFSRHNEPVEASVPADGDIVTEDELLAAVDG